MEGGGGVVRGRKMLNDFSHSFSMKCSALCDIKIH